MTTVARFEIEYTRFLDEAGHLAASTPADLAAPDSVIAAYRLMTLTRTFDSKAVALQRTGRLGTYASCLGQEAIGAGVGLAMHAHDVLAPSYREQAAQFARGVAMAELLLYWGGDERGSDFSNARQDFPVCVPIATQCCHAVGAAYALMLGGQSRAVVSLCGDGATSRGDFYESINLAGVWKLPVVFVVSNNQWAISVPRSAQSAAQTIAQKAVAAGFEGLQVDGNDVIAVRWAARDALTRARDGGGPTLIEAITYRLHDHTTADNASRYRAEAEVERMRALDPLTRTRAYLQGTGAWTQSDEQTLRENCANQVQQAVDTYLDTPPQSAASMFDYLYAELPAALVAQREEALRAENSDHG